eukprot:scaffold282418_cov17-Prasinocladus_malaysianus.AAC.1
MSITELHRELPRYHWICRAIRFTSFNAIIDTVYKYPYSDMAGRLATTRTSACIATRAIFSAAVTKGGQPMQIAWG